MKTFTVKFENKGFNFNRALKELKSLSIWGVKMKYSNQAWTLIASTKEQKDKVFDKMDYGWTEISYDNTKPCKNCGTYCDGDCGK